MANVPMLDINDVNQEPSFADTTLCDIKDENKESENTKEEMGASKGFFQLIYTTSKQNIAIKSLFSEKGWILRAKALSEDSLNFCARNGDEDIGTFVKTTFSDTLNGVQRHKDAELDTFDTFDNAKRNSRDDSCADNYNNDIAEQRTKWSDEENLEQDSNESKMENNEHETNYMDYVVVKTEVIDPSVDTQKETSHAHSEFNPNVSVKVEPEEIDKSVIEAEPTSSVDYDSEMTVSGDGEDVAAVEHDSESTLSGAEEEHSTTDTVSETEHSKTMDTFDQSVENCNVNNAKSEVDREEAPENAATGTNGNLLDPTDNTGSMNKLKEEPSQSKSCTNLSVAASCTTVTVAPNTSNTQAVQPYGFNTDVPSNVAQASGFQLTFPPKMKMLYDQYVQVTNLFYSTISSVNKEEQLKNSSPGVPAVPQVGVRAGNINTAQSTANILSTNNPSPVNYKPTTVNLSRDSSNPCNINTSNSSINSLATNQTLASVSLMQPAINIPQGGQTSCGNGTQFPVKSFTINSLRASLSTKKKTINPEVFLAAHHRKRKKKPANTTTMNQEAGNGAALYGSMVIPPSPYEKKDFQCLICMKFFSSRRSVRKHVYGSHPGVTPPLDCTVCLEPFATREELQRHKKEKGHRWAKQKQYQCKQCGEFMVRQEALFQHDQIPHTEKDKFPCVICGKVFNTAVKANTHNRLVHVSAECTCDVCGKVFDKTRALEEHKKRHNPLNKKHMCHHCGKRFFNSGSMALHMTIHTGLKPFKCDVCDYASGIKANMNKHMKIHLKKRAGGGAVAETVPDGD